MANTIKYISDKIGVTGDPLPDKNIIEYARLISNIKIPEWAEILCGANDMVLNDNELYEILINLCRRIKEKEDAINNKPKEQLSYSIGYFHPVSCEWVTISPPDA